MGTYVWSYPFQVLNKLKTFCQIEQTPPPLTTTKKEKKKKKEMCSWSIKVSNELCLYWCGLVLAWVYTSSSLL